MKLVLSKNAFLSLRICLVRRLNWRWNNKYSSPHDRYFLWTILSFCVLNCSNLQGAFSWIRKWGNFHPKRGCVFYNRNLYHMDDFSWSWKIDRKKMDRPWRYQNCKRIRSWTRLLWCWLDYWTYYARVWICKAQGLKRFSEGIL